MTSPNLGNEATQVSAATATEYVQQMVRLETVSAQTKERAIQKLARDYGFTESQLIHLHKAKAKSCDVTLFMRIKQAYYDRAAKLAARLLHEMQIEEALSGNAHDQDLADRIGVVLEEALAKRAKINAGGEVK